MSLDVKLTTLLLVAESQSGGMGPVSFKLQEGGEVDLANGNLAGQANLVYAARRNLAASANEVLDLNGVLTDPIGNVLNFTAIKLIMIEADPGNTNDVVIGGAASNTWTGPFGDPTDAIKVRPGGQLVLVAPNTGWTVTPGTADQLKAANSGAGSAVSYKIILVGI